MVPIAESELPVAGTKLCAFVQSLVPQWECSGLCGRDGTARNAELIC
jgi:hypothetical protein